MNKAREKVSRLDYIIWILIILCEVIFFRNVIFSDRLIGNNIDGKLLTLFVEHWYQVFQGNAVWTELPSFYPAEGVLSYSDIMLGFAIPYSFFRILGVNKYLAFKVVVILTHMVGAFAMYYLCRRCMRLHSLASFLAVIVFFYSNGFYFVIGNAQMVAMSAVPVLCIMLLRYYQFINEKKRHFYGITASLFLVLLFYTAFYVAYYFVVLVMLAAAVFVVCSLFAAKDEEIKRIYRVFIGRWRDYVCYIVIVVISMLPMIRLYLPTLNDIGGRDWAEIVLYSPDIRGAFGFEINNIMQLDENLCNLKYGMPVVEGICLIVCAICAFIIMRKHNGSKVSRLVLVTLFVTAVVSFFLPIVIEGYSLWYIIWKLLPGASALRAMDRWIAFAQYPIAILFAVSLDVIIKRKKVVGIIVAVVSSVITFVSNCSDIGVSSTWTQTEELAFEDSVASPPKECEVFYIVDTSDRATWGEEIQMDAWMIAQNYDIKTINGYSGQTPPDWHLDVLAEDYEERVADWLNMNNIDTSHLYVYRLQENCWEKYGE